MAMPGRSFSAGSQYRYGFNGKENDKDISNGAQDYGMRINDVRLGRFLSLDPLAGKFPMLTPYQFASNNPIQNIDLDGLEGVNFMDNPLLWFSTLGEGWSHNEGALYENVDGFNRNVNLFGIVGHGLYTIATGKDLITSTPKNRADAAADMGVKIMMVATGEELAKGLTVGNPLERTMAFNKKAGASSVTKPTTAAKVIDKAEQTTPMQLWQAEAGPSLKTAGGNTINNSKWANQINPKALTEGYNISVKANGYPDFSKFLYTKAPNVSGSVQPYNTVNISMTGSYANDFAAANKIAGFSKTPVGFTWHHGESLGEMQLVNSEAHAASRHSGGVQLYKEANGGNGY